MWQKIMAAEIWIWVVSKRLSEEAPGIFAAVHRLLFPSCGTRALYLWRVDSVLCGLWGLISSTRDQTHVPYVGRQVVNSGPPGKSVIVF